MTYDDIVEVSERYIEFGGYIAPLLSEILNFVKSQKAEIEILNEEKESLRKSWDTALGVIKRQDAELEKLQKYINRTVGAEDVKEEQS